jgi:hypothetical protein
MLYKQIDTQIQTEILIELWSQISAYSDSRFEDYLWDISGALLYYQLKTQMIGSLKREMENGL